MKRAPGIWKNNSLSIVLFTLFVASLLGQSCAGWKDFNEEARQHGQEGVSYGGFVRDKLGAAYIPMAWLGRRLVAKKT